MTTKPKKKLCWNCEGSTSFEEENCPFCGVYLSPLSINDSEGKESLFAPPYRLNHPPEEQPIPASPYATEEVLAYGNNEKEEGIVAKDNIDSSQETLMPLCLLLAGSVFSLFGFILFFFSENSLFTLQWDSSFWPLYCVLGIPMLFFGWRALQQLDE